MATAAKASSNGSASATPTIDIDRLSAETLRVPIIGTAPLLAHRFSERSKRAMLDAMQGRQVPKEPKDPKREFEEAIYRLEDGSDGIPAVAFKKATVSGARFYKKISMVELRQFIFFRGEPSPDGRGLVRLEGEWTAPEMREDVVRVGKGGSDLRYRPQYRDWGATLTVVYFTSCLTRSSVLSLIDAGGLGSGVGDWRPEKSGDFGTYMVDPDREVEVIE
jgi:hypothetical protein